jgi:dTMP kinase
VTALRFYGEPPPGLPDTPLPGRLIVIEGTDGVGRSTHVSLLKEWLEARGYAVINTGLRRSDLAGRGIERAKRGNTLDPLTLNLLYATDFCDRMERQILPALRAGMVALVDRYVFSLIARARVRGLTIEWVENLYGFALIPDLVIYLDIDIKHLVPRVLSTTGFDYWESGQDYLPGPDVYFNFVEHQTRLLAEFRRLAREHAFQTVDARGPVADVFRALSEIIEPVVQDMATLDSVGKAEFASLSQNGDRGLASMRRQLPGTQT